MIVITHVDRGRLDPHEERNRARHPRTADNGMSSSLTALYLMLVSEKEHQMYVQSRSTTKTAALSRSVSIGYIPPPTTFRENWDRSYSSDWRNGVL